MKGKQRRQRHQAWASTIFGALGVAPPLIRFPKKNGRGCRWPEGPGDQAVYTLQFEGSNSTQEGIARNIKEYLYMAIAI